MKTFFKMGDLTLEKQMMKILKTTTMIVFMKVIKIVTIDIRSSRMLSSLGITESLEFNTQSKKATSPKK